MKKLDSKMMERFGFIKFGDGWWKAKWNTSIIFDELPTYKNFIDEIVERSYDHGKDKALENVRKALEID